MDTTELTSTDQTSTAYDGFISYSHAADDLLAPRLQAGLQRFAKPWWKRRGLRIFRDESSLSANPHLWSSVTEALDQSAWFVLLLSPDAAQSEWVNQEIEYWKNHKDPSRILPVLTDGTFTWTGDDITGNAAPQALQGVFSEEPRWVDMRFAQGEEQLDLKSPRFSAAVADIASALRGVPKDELESEEVKQHRRTIRTAWAAGGLVAILAIAATVFGVQSARNADEAERQAEIASHNEATAVDEAERADANAEEAALNAQLAAARELAASSIAVLENDPELSTLLAIQAIGETPAGVEHPIEVINALWRGGSSNRLLEVYPTETGSNIALSNDGTRLAVSEDRRLRMLDAATGEQIWSYTEDTVDFFDRVDIGPDGRVALGVLNSDAPGARIPTNEVDEFPNRIVILDGDTADVVVSLEYPECSGAENPVWSPDGRYLAVSSGSTGLSQDRAPGCPRQGATYWIEVFETENWTPVAFLPMEGSSGPRPVWDDSGALHGLTPVGGVLTLEPETFELRPPTTATGIGDVSPDGSRYVVSVPSLSSGNPFNAFLMESSTGEVSDVLNTKNNRPSAPNGIEITPDGSLAVIGTQGSHTFVYELATNEDLYRLATGPVLASAYDPITQRLYTAGSDPGVKVWDLQPSTVGVDPVGNLGRFSFVNGNSFETGPQAMAMDTIDFGSNFQRQVQLFDPATGDLGPTLVDHADPAALANGKWVVSQSIEDQGKILWDPETGEQVEILGCEVPVEDEFSGAYCAGDNEPRWWRHMASPDGEDILAFGSSEIVGFTYSGHFRRFDSDTGEIIESVVPGDSPSPSDPLARLRAVLIDLIRGREPVFLTDEWGFVPGPQERAAYDLATGEALFRSGGAALGLDLSPDRKLIAFSESVSVTLLDTTTWEEGVRISTGDRVRGLGFNADGSRLAIGGLQTLQIVNTASGQAVQQMALAGVSDIHWIDDETILVATNTGIVGTVSLSTDDFLTNVREGLRRSFTEQECDLYRIDPCPTLEEMRGG